jgi:hypothetical protein
LPCNGRDQITKALRVDVDRLIFGAWAIIVVLFASGAAWGTISRTVEINTRKWEYLEPEHRKLMVDVSSLKTKSYGYRDIPVQVVGHDNNMGK